MTKAALKDYLDFQVEQYNKASFIEDDPISIPHRFDQLQDIEIIGFWVAMLAWGQRKTIINKANELITLMDNAPYDFVLNHEEKDREKLLSFKHRTFQATDTLYFLEFLQWFYRKNDSLEKAFLPDPKQACPSVEAALIHFHELFFSLPNAPQRTRKHIATPARKSSCKRLNMFLRWMVRKDERGVDFGLWKRISSSQLLMPLDVHVDRVARRLGLLKRKQTDWLSVLELTENLRAFDANDPVKYDFALFSIGVLEKSNS
ncbi:MAG: TIGR02757 family protein [Bacteroidota bacterium]